MVLGLRLGTILHFSFDAVLVSAVLAGVRRSTGLTVQPKKITESEQLGKFIDNYLWAGETAFDYGVAFMGGSKYFERRR